MDLVYFCDMKIIITLSLALVSYASRAVIIMPMPIIESSNGGMPLKDAIAFWIVLNTFCITWLSIRYYVKFRNESEHTYFWRRFFTEDWGYSWDDFNFPTIGLIVINAIAILFVSVHFVSSII